MQHCLYGKLAEGAERCSLCWPVVLTLPSSCMTLACSDVICDYPLKDMLDFHRARGAEATILVTKVCIGGRGWWSSRAAYAIRDWGTPKLQGNDRTVSQRKQSLVRPLQPANSSGVASCVSEGLSTFALERVYTPGRHAGHLQPRAGG